MYPEIFTKFVVPTKVLNTMELYNIYMYINLEECLSLRSSITCPFETTPRGNKKDAQIWKNYDSAINDPSRGWNVRESDGKVSAHAKHSHMFLNNHK